MKTSKAAKKQPAKGKVAAAKRVIPNTRSRKPYEEPAVINKQHKQLLMKPVVDEAKAAARELERRIIREATDLLKPMRDELEKETNRRYEDMKWMVVKRLAAEHGVQGPVVVDIFESEELRVS